MRQRHLVPLFTLLCAVHAWGQNRIIVNPRAAATRPAPPPLPPITINLPTTDRYTEITAPWARLSAGPNNRLWVTQNPPDLRLSQAKDSLRAEFDRPEPHLLGLFPLLFEPAGRVWFTFSGNDDSPQPTHVDILIGYDGKTFIERPSPIRLPSPLPAQPGGPAGFTALYADHTAFFAVGPLVYAHNEQGWTSRELISSGAQPADAAIRLFPQTDLKGIVAVTADGDLWHCAQGVWKGVKVGQPGASSAVSQPVKGLAATPAGLYLFDGNGLSFTDWDAKGPATVDELIAQLDAPDPQLRSQAEAALVRMGPRLGMILARQLSPDTDPARSRRLNTLITQANRGVGITPRTFTIGDFQVARPVFLVTLRNGRALLGASVIVPASHATAPATTAPAATRPARAMSDDPALAGVLEISVDGVERAGGRDYLAALLGAPDPLSISGFTPAIAVIPNTSHAWVAPILPTGNLSLIDLATRRVVKTLPLPLDAPITAPVSDDLVIFTTRSGPQIAVRPAPADPVAVLKPIFSDSIRGNTENCIAQTADGAAWYWSARGLALFDGARPMTLPHAASLDQIQLLVPGKDALIVQARDKWYLLTRTELLGGEPLEDLILHHRDRIASIFGGAPAPNRMLCPVFIFADSTGSIWLYRRSEHTLKTLVGTSWIDPADALRSAGSRNTQVESFLRAGNSRVYLVTQRRSNIDTEKVAFFGQVDHGVLALTDAPAPMGAARTDARGDLWITIAASRNTRAVVRYSQDNAHQMFDGRLRVPDEQGDPLLFRPVPNSRPPTEHLALLHNGTAINLPDIPFFGPDDPLMPAINGHLYAQTQIGLRDLRPSGSGPTASFELGPLFSVGPGAARADVCFVSSTLYTIAPSPGEGVKIRFFYPPP